LAGKNTDRTPSQKRQPLSRDRIVSAALDLIESGDAGELSMRAFGERLGVEAMSLYRYLPSKAAPLGSARSFREAIAERPKMVPLIQARGTQPLRLKAVWKASHLVWESAGADPYTANQLQLAVGAYVIGAPLWEASQGQGAAGEASEEPAAAFIRTAERLRWELAFELGLGLLLDGIEAELRRRKANTAPKTLELAS